MRAIGRERGQRAERLARDTAGRLGEKAGAGCPSASTGRSPTGSGRGAPRAGLAGRGRERAVPGDRTLRAWAHLPRDQDPYLGHPKGAPFGWPPPPGPRRVSG